MGDTGLVAGEAPRRQRLFKLFIKTDSSDQKRVTEIIHQLRSQRNAINPPKPSTKRH